MFKARNLSLVFVAMAILSSIVTVHSSEAAEVRNLSEVGFHHQVLLIEKNENPQNKIVVYARVDEKCRFIKESGKNRSSLIGFYWLIDKNRYKPLSAFAERRIYDKLNVQSTGAVEAPDSEPSAWKDSLRLRSDLLARFSPKLKDTKLEIRAREKNGRCEVRTFAHLPQSNEPLRLTSVFSELKKTWLPPFRKVLSVTLKGRLAETGRPIQTTIRGS